MFFSRSRTSVPPVIAEALDGHFNDAELKALSRLGTMVSLDEGAVLTVEGQPGREALVIVSGTADVVAGTEVIATVGEGTIIGEMALVLGEPRSATVVATTPLSVFVMNRREFAALLDECPRLEANVQELVAQRQAA